MEVLVCLLRRGFSFPLIFSFSIRARRPSWRSLNSIIIKFLLKIQGCMERERERETEKVVG